jgi:hypothetical protein
VVEWLVNQRIEENLSPLYHDDDIGELSHFLEVDERDIPPTAGSLTTQPPDAAASPRIFY